MIRKILLSIGILGVCLNSQAQQSFILADLIQKAEQNYPTLKQKDYVTELGNEMDKLLNASLIPSMSVIGQSTYQSEVTKFGSPGSGFPILPYDNSSIGLDLHLPLTEFGVVSSRKELEKAKTDVAIKQLDIELQRIRERVTNSFGNVLLQLENKKVLLIRIAELTAQQKKVSVAVVNGATLKSNQLVFESEILITEQKIVEIDAALESLTKELAILTGLAIDPKSNFQALSEVPLQKNINRPELQLFSSQINVFEIQKKVLRRDNLPKFSIFGQGNYGRPGYNFLNINYRTYGIVGASLNWNINNFVIQKKKIHLFEINSKIIESQKTIFDMNLQITLAQKETEINKYLTILSKDEEIVSKRKEILKAASSQLENGTITSTEYLTELNATNTAELNQVLHQVQQSIAKTQYNILTGN